MDFSLSVMKQCVEICCYPSRAKRNIGRVFKFADVHYKNMSGVFLASFCKKKDDRHGQFFDFHLGFLYILRLFLICGRLNVFMDNIFNKYISLLWPWTSMVAVTGCF